jgi:hypothetical protein
MVVAITALVVALGGVAVASPVGGDGKVYLCFDQEGMDTLQSGAVRAVKAGTPCPDGFTSFVLNQTGPEGKAGPVGAPGTPGPQGPGGEKLPKPISKDLIDELKQADKLADKNRGRLSELEEQIARMKRDAEQLKMEAMLRQQQRLVESIKQIASAVSQVAGTNRKVIQGID